MQDDPISLHKQWDAMDRELRLEEQQRSSPPRPTIEFERTGPDSLAVKIDGTIVWEIRRSGMYLDGKPVWVDTHGFLRLGDGEPEEPDDPEDVERRLRGTPIEQARRPR
jgi:hypothetical protein